MTAPPLRIEIVAAQPKLVGWEEFDHWARCHDGLWAAVTANARSYRVSELDTLRLLASELLLRCDALQKQVIQQQAAGSTVHKIIVTTEELENMKRNITKNVITQETAEPGQRAEIPAQDA